MTMIMPFGYYSLLM